MNRTGTVARVVRRAGGIVLVSILALAGCRCVPRQGDTPLPGEAETVASVPGSEYLYDFVYPGSYPEGDRSCHARRVIEDRNSGAVLHVMGRRLGSFGSDAASSWLAQVFFMGDLPGAEQTLGRLYAAGVPRADTPTFELAMATTVMASAVENRRRWFHRANGFPLEGTSRGDLIQHLAALSSALVERQQPDGTWGGPVETAWSLQALVAAVEQGPMVRARTGDEWRRAGPAVLDLWSGDDDAGQSAVDRLHRAAAVWLAQRVSPTGPSHVGAGWFQKQFRGLNPGDDTGTWFAAGYLWMVLGPAADPDHPLQGCKAIIRDAYLSGRLRARSPGELFEWTMAIESFGWDAFGSVMGYLMTENWPPLEEK